MEGNKKGNMNSNKSQLNKYGGLHNIDHILFKYFS